MKTVEIPREEYLRIKKKTAYERKRKALGGMAFFFAILAILSLIGAIVSIVLTELGGRPDDIKTLLYILVGAFVGGALAFALLAFLFSKLSQTAFSQELDFRERCDGENSFFVGEGTLATFEEKAIRLHAEQGGHEEILVPYSEMRFFSVCTRHKPREKGDWSVVIEIPVKYLSSKGSKDGEKPALVQADAKERLYRCLDEHALTLDGEREGLEKKGKFTPLKKFSFPDAPARKRTLVFLVLGIVLLGAGIGLSFKMITVGAVLAVFGIFLTLKSTFSFLAAKRVLAFYQEGVYWREKNINDSVFLKWEEIKSLSAAEQKGLTLMKAECDYGAYHFLSTAEALEFAKTVHPEK